LFLNDTGAVQVTLRTVRVTLTDPAPPVDLRPVFAADAQPGGPAYTFAISTYEVTNAAFAAFLNDTIDSANRVNQRGQYMYHDTDSGDVYVNSIQPGEAGPDGSQTLTVKMYSASVNAYRISYDLDLSLYVAAPGSEQHPLTGVSWFGALKYCNWLTIDQGLGPPQRCYHEGPATDLDEWRPVTITKSEWQVRDLNDSERQALVDNYAGFRLPMDDGSDNTDPWSDAADAYNEWYKAAAWDQSAGVNRIYGFGRDDISTNGADANYWNSGDPFDNGTTPGGFFDGVNLLGDGVTATLDTDSFYGLYDMSGNVAEWTQDRYSTTSTRALRGGSWASFEAQGIWIRNFDRNFASPSLVWGEIGFRVVRAINQVGDGNGDGVVDLADFAIMHACLTGPGGGPLDGTCLSADCDSDGDVDLADFAAFQTVLSAQ
ncbi:MAG: SUMF1/EgtB/PvdO family nonheme iron enzyme, partial [Planctomycetota bacterium]